MGGAFDSRFFACCIRSTCYSVYIISDLSVDLSCLPFWELLLLALQARWLLQTWNPRRRAVTSCDLTLGYHPAVKKHSPNLQEISTNRLADRDNKCSIDTKFLMGAGTDSRTNGQWNINLV